MRNPIRNETSLVLVVVVIFTAVAIPALSGFLEPSQPPSVGTIQIGDPRDGDDSAPSTQIEGKGSEPAGDAQRQRSARPPARERLKRSARPAPADDDAEDDGGEAD